MAMNQNLSIGSIAAYIIYMCVCVLLIYIYYFLVVYSHPFTVAVSVKHAAISQQVGLMCRSAWCESPGRVARIFEKPKPWKMTHESLKIDDLYDLHYI